MATCKTVENFLVSVYEKPGFWEMLIPILIEMLPVFVEMLQAWLEECAQTEEEAVNLLCNPTMLQAMVANRQIHKSARRNDDYKRSSWVAQRQFRTHVMNRVVETANEDPQAVAEMFRAVKG